MPLEGIKPGRLGIEHDLAHVSAPLAPAVRTNHRRFGIVATAARIARTCARAASKPREVSTTKSARRRFSCVRHLLGQDGFELFHGHAGALKHARALDLAGADTTTTASTRSSPPVSNRSGMSSTATFSPRASASARSRRSASCTSGMNDGLEPFERRVVAQNARGQLVAIDLAVRGGAGKRRLDRRHRLALVEPMHDRIGVVHRHAFLGEEARRRRLSHAERAGQTEDEHAASTKAFARKWIRFTRKSITSADGAQNSLRQPPRLPQIAAAAARAAAREW